MTQQISPLNSCQEIGSENIHIRVYNTIVSCEHIVIFFISIKNSEEIFHYVLTILIISNAIS